jgi:hypothetical protein
VQEHKSVATGFLFPAVLKCTIELCWQKKDYAIDF